MSDYEPIIIGVADIANRTSNPIEPLDLISSAVRDALADTALSDEALVQLKATVDELVVVKSWTWPYDQLSGLVGERTGLQGASVKRETAHGGNSPVKALDEVCREIVQGKRKVGVLCGGEALASLTECAKKGTLPPPKWTPTRTSIQEVFSPTTRELAKDLGGRHGIGAPIQVYPLYENAFRAHRGQKPRDNHRESAELYAEFAQVAAGNGYAWAHGKETVTTKDLETVDRSNRMICWPYPLLMNAFNNVNLAAAVVVTSIGTARALGVPKEKWVHVLSGAGTSESSEFWLRPSFTHSPAISSSIDAALSASGLSKDDIDMHDFYSCFPIVPKLACEHLGLPITGRQKPITLLGGLTSFGGAGNNYSMHALTASTRALRQSRSKQPARRTSALVFANGGVLTYQHVAILSSQPRSDGHSYPARSLLPEYVDVRAPRVDEHANGEGTIETYTVDFDKKGTPVKGHVVGRLSGGARFLANMADEWSLQRLTDWDQEPVGRKGRVRYDSESKKCLFTFTSDVAKRRARL